MGEAEAIASAIVTFPVRIQVQHHLKNSLIKAKNFTIKTYFSVYTVGVQL